MRFGYDKPKFSVSLNVINANTKLCSNLLLKVVLGEKKWKQEYREL